MMQKLCFTACMLLLGYVAKAQEYVLVIHGGAGTILQKNMTPEMEAQYKASLEAALKKGYAVLQSGRPALDAVETCIRVLEDDSLFNAGKGAVFTHDGRNELDASIMDGKTLAAGAVAGVRTVRNPITLARAVMEKSGHVMLAGRGAEKFAAQVGMETVDTSYFRTEKSWKALQRALRAEAGVSGAGDNSGHAVMLHAQQDGVSGTGDNSGHAVVLHAQQDGVSGTGDNSGHGVVLYAQQDGDTATAHDSKFGTVGCVALDRQGNLAAGTSTGGMTNKKFGRIGDSPIIGAGTYANNNTVAVSCTGWGEFYIRNVVAFDLSALMAYKGLSVQEAGDAVIKKVGDAGGNGGLIALDKDGNMAMPFNTAGMFRGCVTKDGKVEVWMYRD